VRHCGIPALVNIFRRRPPDPTEDALRRLSKTLRWARPPLADAPTPTAQLGHLAQHRLCTAIDRGDPAPTLTAFVIAEEALAGADLDNEPGAHLDYVLTIGLIEVISDWCSWPETPPEVAASVEASLGPLTSKRWDSVRGQGAAVAAWIRDGGALERAGGTPAEYRAIDNEDLRFTLRSSRQFIDETLAVGTADRVRFEKATGQGV